MKLIQNLQFKGTVKSRLKRHLSPSRNLHDINYNKLNEILFLIFELYTFNFFLMKNQ